MYNDIKTKVVSPAGAGAEFEIKVDQGSMVNYLLFNIIKYYVTKYLQTSTPWTLLYVNDIVLIAARLQKVQD